MAIRRPYPAECTYIVSWRQHGIVKPGYTSQHRYRTFTSKGARLLYLFEAPPLMCMNALLLEWDIAEALHMAGAVPAFACRDDSADFMGPRGGGWRECWRIPEDDAVRAVQQMLRVLLRVLPRDESGAVPEYEAARKARNERNGRNGRTNERSGFPPTSILQVADAHEHNGALSGVR